MRRTGMRCLPAAAATGTLGPSSFDVEIPAAAVVGESVPVTFDAVRDAVGSVVGAS